MKTRELHRFTVKAIFSKKTPGRYADGGGLYLQVGPTGTKAWLFRFTLKGKAREMGLGPLHTVPLASRTERMPDGSEKQIRGARDLAADARRLLLQGIDPIEARTASLVRERLVGARSKPFKDCAVEFIKAHRAEWKSAKHAAQWETTLETYCYNVFGDLPVSKIDTGDVLKAIEPIWQSKRETASRLRGRIEKILDWATVRGYREGLNPARWRGHLDHTLPKQSRSKRIQHHPALSYMELSGFMKKLRALGGTAPKALEWIILTAVRTNEAIGAKWDEFDLLRKVWIIPGTRMKAGREHKVPISDAALAVLSAMGPSRPGEYVFASSRGDQPLSNMACLAVLKRMGREDVTTHGFRSTFRDWASEKTTFQREVIEMSLAHAISDKVEAAYRRGDLFEKRRRLMDAWAAFAQRPTLASVHPISDKRRAVPA